MSHNWTVLLLILGLTASATAGQAKRTPWARAYLQSRKLAKAGQFSKAARLLKRSLDMASKPSERVRSLCTMGKVLEAAHKPDLALKTYQYGLKEINRGGDFPVAWIRGLRQRVKRLNPEPAEAPIALASDPVSDLSPFEEAPPPALNAPFFASVSAPTSKTSETSETVSPTVIEAAKLLASTDPSTRARAIPLLEGVAARGNGKAMCMLGLVHIADALGRRSREAGVRFLELAADEGDEVAKSLLRTTRDPNELAEKILSEGLIGTGSVAD